MPAIQCLGSPVCVSLGLQAKEVIPVKPPRICVEIAQNRVLGGVTPPVEQELHGAPQTLL